MQKKRWVVVVAVPCAALALSACSVTQTGVTGIARVDDRVVAMVRTCEGTTAHKIDMIPAGGQFVLLPHPSWDFEPGSSVVVDLGAADAFVEGIGDREMRLDTSLSGGFGSGPRFTADDLSALDDGEILTYIPDDLRDDPQAEAYGALTEAEFDEVLDSVCNPTPQRERTRPPRD